MDRTRQLVKAFPAILLLIASLNAWAACPQIPVADLSSAAEFTSNDDLPFAGRRSTAREASGEGRPCYSRPLRWYSRAGPIVTREAVAHLRVRLYVLHLVVVHDPQVPFPECLCHGARNLHLCHANRRDHSYSPCARALAKSSRHLDGSIWPGTAAVHYQVSC